jgi:hypothetical protein
VRHSSTVGGKIAVMVVVSVALLDDVISSL